jgi:hypothetical protein
MKQSHVPSVQRVTATILFVASLLLPVTSWGQELQTARLGTMTLGGSVAAAAAADHCTQRVADDFSGNLSNWTASGDGSWAVASGQAEWTETGSYQYGNLRYNTATTGATQYIKVSFAGAPSASSTTGVMLRIDTDLNPGYWLTVKHDGSLIWDDYGVTVETVASTSFDGASETLCAIIKGTGNSTVVSVWYNCTAVKPLSGGGVCTDTAKPCWDNAGDAPDYQATNNPTTAADATKYVGLTASSGSNTSGTFLYDNFYAGDCDD